MPPTSSQAFAKVKQYFLFGFSLPSVRLVVLLDSQFSDDSGKNKIPNQNIEMSFRTINKDAEILSQSYNIIENFHQFLLLTLVDLIIGKSEYKPN